MMVVTYQLGHLTDEALVGRKIHVVVGLRCCATRGRRPAGAHHEIAHVKDHAVVGQRL